MPCLNGHVAKVPALIGHATRHIKVPLCTGLGLQGVWGAPRRAKEHGYTLGHKVLKSHSLLILLFAPLSNSYKVVFQQEPSKEIWLGLGVLT